MAVTLPNQACDEMVDRLSRRAAGEAGDAEEDPGAAEAAGRGAAGAPGRGGQTGLHSV